MPLRALALQFLTLVLFVAGPVAHAGGFEGKVTYAITYQELPPEAKSMQSMLPKEMIIEARGPKLRLEQSILGGAQVVVTDLQAKEVHILMDMMGQKIHMEQPFSEEDMDAKPTVELLGGKQKVAGYPCKQAKVTAQDGSTTTVWYTEKLGPLDNEYRDLPGLVLEYSSNANGMAMTMTASAVDTAPVPEARFAIPEGYRTMTEQEMQQMMMGGGK